jgi:hypothetical protein
MTKFDFALLMTLVMIVFLILDALHVTFVPSIRTTPSWFVETVETVQSATAR